MDYISKCGGKKISSLDLLWDPGGSPESPFFMHVFVRASPSRGGLLPVFTSLVGWGSFLLLRTFGKIPFCFPEPGIQFWVWFFFLFGFQKSVPVLDTVFTNCDTSC